MALIGIMVVHNEAHRYLAASVMWMRRLVDELVVFDDQSTDDTVEVARNAGAIVKVRPNDCPSFLENEAKFRQAAWEVAGRCFNLTTESWVLSQDADEFLLSKTVIPIEALMTAIDTAEGESCNSIDLPVVEVFDMVGPRPMVRTDGDWGRIRAARIGRWQDTPTFEPSALNSGSLPVIPGPPLHVGDLCILHCGYRRLNDRKAKMHRYSKNRAGHGGAHVKSIMQPGIYEPWSYPIPPEIAEALS